MKVSRLNWALGLISLLWTGLPVWALEAKDVFARLTQIPVFTLVNDKGNPVLVTPKQNNTDKTAYASFFLNPDEVQGLLNLLKSSDPALAKTVRIQAIPLSRALMFAEAQKANKKPVKVDVVPHRQSLEYALTVAQQSNKDLKKFPGVPVFALTDLKGQKVISVKRKDSDQPSQIYFFDEVDAQTAFTSLKAKNPQLAAQTRISAAPFQNLLGALFKMQKPAEADRIILYPSTAALRYAQTLAPKPKKS